MSLSQKIAAALDENTEAYVLPCAVTVEDGPNRLALHLTALDPVGAGLRHASSSPRPTGPSGRPRRSRPGATGSPPASPT